MGQFDGICHTFKTYLLFSFILFLLGLVIDLLDRLKELGGFNYTLYYAPDRLYGKKDETTFQWNGLINEVYTKASWSNCFYCLFI